MLTNPITATYAALAALAVIIYKVVKRQRELNREYEESVGKIHAQYIETKKYADSIKELVERQNELIEANKNLSQDSDEYKENQQEISDIEERRKEVIQELIKIDPDYAKSIQNAGRDLNVLIPLAEEYNEKLRARLGLESSLKDINVEESSEKYNNAATEQRAALGNLEKTRNILLKQAKELLASDTLYESERKALEEFVNGSEPYYKRAIKLREDLQKVFIDLGTTEQAYGLGTRTVKKTGISTLWQKLDFESRDSIEKYIKALDKLSRKEKKVVEDMSTVAEEFRGLEMGARLTSIIADENATQEDKDKAKNKIIDFFEEVLNEKGIVGAIADKARSLWSSLFNIDWKKVPIPTKLTGWRAAYDEFLKTLSTDAVPSITEEEDESDYIETLKRTYESYAKDIEGWDAKNAKLRAQYSKDEIDVIRLQNEERKKALDWLVYEKDKSADSGENEELKRLNERIRLVRELRKEYEDLNKTFGDVESEERVRNSYREAWESIMPEDMSIDLFDFTDPKGVVKQLEELKTKLSPEAIDLIKTIQKAIAGESVEIDVNFKKGKDKELLDDIQELFDQYDLSLELKKLNIPSDLAKSLFDVDYLDLEGLKKAVQEQREAFVGKDMLEEYNDLMKKIGELSRKQREDDAKEFINFLKKNLNEIQIIQDKGAYNIALADKLFGKGKITAEQYMSSIRQIVSDTNKEISRLNLEKFKDSATYIKAMGNLAAYSRDELEGMINALQGQVGANAGNMGADEIRAYYEALERLVKQYDKIESPFQKGEINDLIEYLGLQKQLNQEKEKEAALEQRKEKLNARLALLQNKLASQQASGDTEGAKFTQGLIKSAVNELKEVDGELVSVTSNISVISEKVANLGDGMIKSLVVAQKVVNEIANIANASTKMFDDIKSAADALGADTESGGWAKAGYAMEMVGGVSSELTQGLANFASGNFAGALANVVGMVTKLISGFAKIHDQNYQDIIEAQAKQVERLGKAYEKLETDTENAYSIQQLQQYNEELERNVELQIASYKAMIAAEKAKKNTDTEQIEAWNEEIEALTQQWDELKQSLVEGVGGVSDYRSQTREFVDSWVSAFKETGDGLSGLKENFREFFDNIIAEQAALRVTEKFLAPFYDSLNSALDDLSLSVEESKNLREEADRIMPQLSEALELIWNQLGGGRAEGESGGLSALQKGIQGITEDTAQVIEAYLNSVRGYVSEQVTYTKRLYEMFDRMSHGTTYGLNVRMIS